MAFNAESVDFDNFNPVTADYGPRDLHAVAAMVTNDNIGQWALEFEKDLEHEVDGKPRFFFVAEREGEEPIKLKVEDGVWIVKVWNELHVFKDGMFQKTFDVPKEQLKAVRKAHRDKRLELDREWQDAKKEDKEQYEIEMEERFQVAEETGDWSNLSDGEKHVLRYRLKEDEEIQEIIEAARLRKTALSEQKVAGKLDLSGVVGPEEERILRDVKENLNREAEQTQFIPQVSVPMRLDGPAARKEVLYPEGEGPLMDQEDGPGSGFSNQQD